MTNPWPLPPEVRKIATAIIVTDEMIVDFQIGDTAVQRAAAERIIVRREEARRRWLALPWWTRAYRRIRGHYHAWQYERFKRKIGWDQ